MVSAHTLLVIRRWIENQKSLQDEKYLVSTPKLVHMSHYLAQSEENKVIVADAAASVWNCSLDCRFLCSER